MQYRTLCGNRTSLLGFGCMRFPLDPNKHIDRAQSFSMLDLAYENGVNYYDTAYLYHERESEEVLGLWQRTKPRETLQIATKLPIWSVHTIEDAEKIFEEQLHKLQTDYIDYYLLHALNASHWEKVLELDIIGLLVKWKAEGKIRKFGFSFHDQYPVFEQILCARNWDFCQIQLNYFGINHQAGIKGLELAKSRNIPVFIMEPVMGGELARSPAPIASKFHAIHPDWSSAAWAFRWCMSLDGVYMILSGMSNLAQVQENLLTFSKDTILTPDEISVLDFAAAYYHSRIQTPCTACRYCLPCPKGVYIPGVFELYNAAHVFGDFEKSKFQFEQMMDTEKPIHCVNCGKCLPLCPQGIAIPSELKKAITYFNQIDLK